MSNALNKRRIAVAVSGGGRSLGNLIRMSFRSGFNFRVVAVISSSGDCTAVKIAKESNLPVFVGNFTQNIDKVRWDLYRWLHNLDVGLIALGGFLKPFPVESGWEQRIVNIHPALLPKFGGHKMYGKHVHQAVLTAGEKETGASIHFVSDEYDAGQLIAQTKVLVSGEETPETLAARVFEKECLLYPRVIQDLVDGKLPQANGDVRIYEF